MTMGKTRKNAYPVEIAIVIVNYKTPGLVKACIDTVIPQVQTLSARIIVVDNASGDDSADQIKSWLSKKPTEYTEKILLVESTINGGFSAGNNLGITHERAEYYLLLNSDTLLREDAIPILLSRIKTDSTIGALGPTLEYLDGARQVSCFRKRGATSEFLRGAQIESLYRVLSKKSVPIKDPKNSPEIDWVSFACVLLPSEAIEKVGLMDDKFFMYFEDIEYCIRLKKTGYLIKQEPRARVVHLRGGTSEVKRNSKSQKKLPEYFYKSRTRYFILLGGRRKLLVANLAFYLGRTIRQLKRFAGKVPGPSIPGEWRALWVDFSKQQN